CVGDRYFRSLRHGLPTIQPMSPRHLITTTATLPFKMPNFATSPSNTPTRDMMT
ncbi:hypothetical protein MYU51_017617, partial [Penicillium brevicompactum]